MSTNKKTISKIKKLISHKREDTFFNHLKTCLFFGYLDYHGEVTEKDFKIWRYSNWIGIAYPVIMGSISLVDGKEKLTIRTKLNPIGQIFGLFFFACFLFIVLSGISSDIFNGSISYYVGIPLLLLLLLLFRYAYRVIKKNCIDDLIKYGDS